MSRLLACVLLSAAVCICAGCGGSGRAISSATALHDLRNAGFTELGIARFTHGSEGHDEIDTIGQRDVALTFLPPVQLIDSASDKTATELYRGPGYVRRWYEADVTEGEGIVPRDFVYSPKKAYSARICNVILWSYNVDNDRRLRGRLLRAARLLRQSCG